MLWFLFGLMLLAATLVVAWPLYRHARRLTLPLAAAVGTVLLVSAMVYSSIGTPVPPAGPENVAAMVASLAARLEEQPADVDGWKMLGNSYMQLERHAEAEQAFQRAVDLESGSNAQTLADLGEAIIRSEGGGLPRRAAQQFETALALEPNNPKALFYGGIAAIERSDGALAADRWESLLALSPPPEIQEILRQGIARWRDEAASAAEPPSTSETIVAVNVSLADPAAAAVDADATVFIIARDPDQPSPPIAAARRRVSELPVSVDLGDADAMIPGRLLSAFERLEIIARVSVSGEPTARPGDWYGGRVVTPADTGSVDIVIEEQVK